MKLTRSTSHRILNPKAAGLVLAALRLGLHLPAPPKPDTRRTEPLDLVEVAA
jgi:hypothetical protein